MRISKIHMENFRSIAHAEIDLDGQSALLFGVNGSGKSSVLQAINLIFERIITKVVQNRFKQSVMMEGTDVRGGTTQCKISVEFSLNGSTYTVGRQLDKKLNKRQDIHPKELERFASDYMQRFESVYFESPEQKSNIPIYVNYGVNRLVKNIPLRIRKTHIFDPLYAYENAIQSMVEFRTFFEWFRNREDYENEVRSHEDPQYRDIQLQAVRQATEIMLPGFKDLCVKRNPLKLKMNKNGVYFDVGQLSDGEKCLLALVGDLARRASMANPATANPLECEGIVLIDEIELHLHPTWQSTFVESLQKMFPNIQFLLTTHSPQVMVNLPDDIKIFRLDPVDSSFAFTEMQNLRGWDVNSILENNMQTLSQNPEMRERISDAYKTIQHGEYDVAGVFVDELEKMTSNKNADVVRLRFLINRGSRK